MVDKEEKGVSLFTADDAGTFEAVSGREDTGGSETARTHDKGPERYKTPGLSTPEVTLISHPWHHCCLPRSIPPSLPLAPSGTAVTHSSAWDIPASAFPPLGDVLG